MKNLKLLLKWIFGIILLVTGLLTILGGSVIGGLFVILGGVILFPPLLKYLESKMSKPLSRPLKYSTTIGSVIVGLIFIMNTNSDSPKLNKIEKPEIKVELKEELPEIKTCVSDLGVLKMDVNGHSIGEKTELTELKNLYQNKDCDIIIITFEWKGSYGDNMPKKIIYNKIENRLQDIYTRTNVIEDYKGVTEEGLKLFFDKGEKNFAALSNYSDVKYDFNTREMKETALGEKPVQNELNSSVKVVADFIKSSAKDASSVKFLEWSKVSSSGDSWIVRCKFKGTNSFNAIVTENKWFYIQNSQVVNTKDIIE